MAELGCEGLWSQGRWARLWESGPLGVPGRPLPWCLRTGGDPGQRGPDGQQGSLQPLLRGLILCVRHTGPGPALGAGAPRRVSSSGSLQVL